MPTLKRRIARILGSLSGNIVIPPDQAHLAPERVHLRRFFAHFGVDCVFDVGANSGQYARMLREDIGFKGPIISFEPIPELANELKAAAMADGSWYVEQVALDREAGPTTFHIMHGSQFSSLHSPIVGQPQIFSGENRVARSITVERSTVAREFERYQALLGTQRPFLKMDTQGNDSEVVRGAGDALSKFVGIQTELAIRQLYEASTKFTEYLAELDRLGFEMSAFVPNNAGHFPMLVEMDCILYRRSAVPQPSR